MERVTPGASLPATWTGGPRSTAGSVTRRVASSRAVTDGSVSGGMVGRAGGYGGGLLCPAPLRPPVESFLLPLVPFLPSPTRPVEGVQGPCDS